MSVRVGDVTPETRLDAWVRGADRPRQVSLADYRGGWIVLVFYPRDFTLIGPSEFAALTRLLPEFVRDDAVVLAASTDSFHSHRVWFESDPRLAEVDFPVLADTGHQLSRDFGVLLEEGAALRGTFVIDPEGVVRHMSVEELEVAQLRRGPARAARVEDRRAVPRRLAARRPGAGGDRRAALTRVPARRRADARRAPRARGRGDPRGRGHDRRRGRRRRPRVRHHRPGWWRSSAAARTAPRTSSPSSVPASTSARSDCWKVAAPRRCGRAARSSCSRSTATPSTTSCRAPSRRVRR